MTHRNVAFPSSFDHFPKFVAKKLVDELLVFLKKAIFRVGKIMENRKLPSKKEAGVWLLQGKLALPPIRFELIKDIPGPPGESLWDFVIEAKWGNKSVRFVVEFKSLFSPKAFEEGLSQCIARSLPGNFLPLLMLPYLRPSQLEALESKGISGVDWCGNGVVITNSLRVFRTGGRNRFITDSPIKNIYRKNTSMVARVFLSVPSFPTVGEIVSEINRRDFLASSIGKTPVTMGTVSKAIKQLEEDLIIERAELIRLLQADSLLDLLKENYRQDKPKPIKLKVDCPYDQLPNWIGRRLGNQASVAAVATGLSSVGRYATMQREEVLSLYCTNLGLVQSLIEGRETDRFANVELIESETQPVYFDAREDDGFHWASPVQAWLELMAGDKRDRETAEQIRDYILRITRRDS